MGESAVGNVGFTGIAWDGSDIHTDVVPAQVSVGERAHHAVLGTSFDTDTR